MCDIKESKDINTWFLIVNPSSGNKNFKNSWNEIKYLLNLKKIQYSFAFSQYTKHEVELVREVIKKGYKIIISVGGDGTLHHVINGVMTQTYIKTNKLKVGIIPLGTGNDWIKTYNIPNSLDKSINVIRKNTTTFQDIGCVTLFNGEKEYFNNLAGIGYDGYVVRNLNNLKKIGSLAFLISGLYSLLSYNKTKYTIRIKNKTLHKECLMILFGICKYSGGGLKLTKNPNPKDGLLDITIVKNISIFDLLLNLPKLYNGDIVYHKKVETYKDEVIQIINHNNSIIEADGEIIGTDSLNVTIIKKAIQIFIS